MRRKKLSAVVMVLSMALGMMLALTGCGSAAQDSATVEMSASMAPQVES